MVKSRILRHHSSLLYYFKVSKNDEIGVQETDNLTLAWGSEFCYDDEQDGLSELTLKAYNYDDQIQCIIFKSATKIQLKEHISSQEKIF